MKGSACRGLRLKDGQRLYPHSWSGNTPQDSYMTRAQAVSLDDVTKGFVSDGELGEWVGARQMGIVNMGVHCWSGVRVIIVHVFIFLDCVWCLHNARAVEGRVFF